MGEEFLLFSILFVLDETFLNQIQNLHLVYSHHSKEDFREEFEVELRMRLPPCVSFGLVYGQADAMYLIRYLNMVEVQLSILRLFHSIPDQD